MAILFSTRRHFPLLLRHLRALSSAVTSLPPPISTFAAKSRLRREFNPDAALSLLSSVSPDSTPAFCDALNLTVRRLARSRRFADIESLMATNKSSPHASEEPFLASLIRAYGSAGMIGSAVSLLEEVPLLCSAPPTTVSFNAVLSACIDAKQYRRVPRLFAKLSEKHSITPDAVSYNVLIKSLCLAWKTDAGTQTMAEMESKGIKPTTVTYTTILDYLYREGKPNDADKLWSEMLHKGCTPDLTSYNVKVMHEALHGTPDNVQALITEIKSAGLKPDTITYNYLITSYCKNGRLKDAKEIYKGLYEGAEEMGCGTSATTFRIFLNYLCENGDLDAGLAVFNDAVSRNRIPDFPTTSVLVKGLVQGSREEEARAVISEVKKRFPKDFLRAWRHLEKELGLIVDEEAADQLETT